MENRPQTENRWLFISGGALLLGGLLLEALAITQGRFFSLLGLMCLLIGLYRRFSD
jgi:hypothetical protein